MTESKKSDKPAKRETAEEKNRRHWLTRFVVRALAVDPPLANLPLDEDGFAQGTKLLSAAQGAKDSPNVPLRMETLLIIAAQSNGQIEKRHNKASGFVFRSVTRTREEKPKKQSFSKDEGEKLIAQEKAKTQTALKKRREEAKLRADAAEKRKSDAAVKREKNRQARLEDARQRALKDPKNVRRIASPNNPNELARIAPALKRAGKGTTTADARQAVADRR